jgi:hypothetical protein
MQTCLQSMRACRASHMQLHVGRVLSRPVQQLQPFAGATQPRHLCNSTSAAATEAAQPAAVAENADGPVSQARERREFKPKTSVKHILVSSRHIAPAWQAPPTLFIQPEPASGLSERIMSSTTFHDLLQAVVTEYACC